jgi:serine/threonine protein kinase
MATQQNCALPSGFQLDHYRVERQLSLGGFSIVYLAYDQDGTPCRHQGIPAQLPGPAGEGEVTPHVTEAHQGAFRYGMKCFFEEGRALAKLVHPNVVRVLNFFRANGTVYMVMQFERGRTLHDYIQKNKGNVRERFIRGVFTRMLNGLREVHAHKLLHLDIKPSNIYLRADGTPVLLDFGAARQTLMSDTPILKPMYTPGFASPEQFTSRDALGPWSDIYSVGPACMPVWPATRPSAPTSGSTTTPFSPRQNYGPGSIPIIFWPPSTGACNSTR